MQLPKRLLVTTLLIPWAPYYFMQQEQQQYPVSLSVQKTAFISTSSSSSSSSSSSDSVFLEPAIQPIGGRGDNHQPSPTMPSSSILKTTNTIDTNRADSSEHHHHRSHHQQPIANEDSKCVPSVASCQSNPHGSLRRSHSVDVDRKNTTTKTNNITATTTRRELVRQPRKIVLWSAPINPESAAPVNPEMRKQRRLIRDDFKVALNKKVHGAKLKNWIYATACALVVTATCCNFASLFYSCCCGCCSSYPGKNAKKSDDFCSKHAFSSEAEQSGCAVEFGNKKRNDHDNDDNGTTDTPTSSV